MDMTQHVTWDKMNIRSSLDAAPPHALDHGDRDFKFTKHLTVREVTSLVVWLSETRPGFIKYYYLWQNVVLIFGKILSCSRQDTSQDLSVSSVTFRVKAEMENAVSVVALINLGMKFVPRCALEQVGDWNLPATTEHGCLPTSGYLLCNNPHEWPCCAAILGALLSVWPYSATFYGYTSPSRRPKWTSLGVPLHFFVLLLSQPPSSYFYSLLSTEIHVNINEVSPSH